MVRKLTKLRIDEVSSVDRGAGEGVKIILMKRHGTAPIQKEQPVETISDVIKDYGGIAAVAKRIVATNDSCGLSEHQFTEQLMQHAKLNKREGESVDKAFERLYSQPEIWQACAICKTFPSIMSLEPILATTDDTSVSEDTGKAYDALMALAEKQRAAAPWLSIAQAFARVMEDQSNGDISRRAVTSFPGRV